MSRPVMASLLLCAAFAAAETSVATEVSSRALRGTVLEQKDKLRQLQSASDAWDAYSGYTGSAEGQAAGAGAAASQAASSGSFFDPLSGSAGYQISDGMGVGASGSTSGSAGVGFSWHFRRMAEASDSPGVSDLSSESASGRALQSDSIQITKRVDGTKSSSGCWGRTSTDFPDTAYLNSLPSGVTGSQRFTYTVNGDTVTVTAHIDTIDNGLKTGSCTLSSPGQFCTAFADIGAFSGFGSISSCAYIIEYSVSISAANWPVTGA